MRKVEIGLKKRVQLHLSNLITLYYMFQPYPTIFLTLCYIIYFICFFGLSHVEVFQTMRP
jgi:hypothetical protein